MTNNYSRYLNSKSENVSLVFFKLLEFLEKTFKNNYGIEKKKTCLHVVNNKAFLGIHFLKNKLRVNIVLNHPIRIDLKYKLDKPSKNIFHNYVDLETPDDLSFVKNI